MIKSISIIIVLFLLLVVGCNESVKPQKPNNLIPKDKMAEVLYDLYIVNAAKGVDRWLLENNGVIPETYVLTKHDIDSLQFANSNAYYAFNTDVYKGIVDKVKERLEREKEVFDQLKKEEQEAEKKRRDSISAARQRKKDSIKKAIKNDTLKDSKLDSIKKAVNFSKT